MKVCDAASFTIYLYFYFSVGLETVYKFHRTVKCPAGGVVAVWSSDSGEEHVPSEGQLVMKEGAWKFGDLVETVLVDKDGEILASRDTKKEAESFGSSRRSIHNTP